ncbi:MAG: DNA-3-methyladenine glycosylase, partial [Nitrososphaeraceae archaeon]|nr:DNA-3-methyladenine glycosylase [Nitrososphaeraceae archaeon]MDW0333385.1 DNA-3-methyladenine glycosylase [Nitrososphaeraceae archaeon]
MSIDPVKYLSKADPQLAGVIKTVGKYSIKIRTNAFLSLVESIIYQQLAGSAANIIYTRFINHYNNVLPKPMQIISTSDIELKSKIGLSSNKVQYLKDLSTKVEQGKINLELLSTMSDEEVIAELTLVKGIGRWTAEMFLIFCLGRPDILPVTDLGIRKAVHKLYSLPELPKPAELLAISQPWRPHRTVASWYLWKSLSKF